MKRHTACVMALTLWLSPAFMAYASVCTVDFRDSLGGVARYYGVHEGELVLCTFERIPQCELYTEDLDCGDLGPDVDIIIHGSDFNDIIRNCSSGMAHIGQYAFGESDCDQITIYGYEGDDMLLVPDVPTYLSGGPDDDTLVGGNAAAWLYGNEGCDLIEAKSAQSTFIDLGGPDDVCGGVEIAIGSGGPNFIVGSGSDDIITTRDSIDYIRSYGGNDEITSGGGDDVIWAGEDDDVIIAGEGDDEVLGEGGEDSIMGGPGADDLDGGEDTDFICGHNCEEGWTWAPGDTDELRGGQGADYLCDYVIEDSDHWYPGFEFWDFCSTIIDSEEVLEPGHSCRSYGHVVCQLCASRFVE